MRKPPPINKNLSNARTDNPHNVRRRIKYANDIKYREKILKNTQRSRSKLRDRPRIACGPWLDRMLLLSSPAGLEELRSHAVTRLSYPDKTPVLCFHQLALSVLLEKSSDTVICWRRYGFLPNPELAVYAPTGKRVMHYSMSQAIRLARALAVTATRKGSLPRKLGPQLLKLQLSRT
jgi:hypothetical protein